ncbi:rCG28618 [Rattus norvegicus]|uniref:RCG28618 n=1 Tax=Rattus norvegicus TaxID=10116 RepID=A6HVN0_RAT|nr:rCG28618 [Rattus norvegicus]
MTGLPLGERILRGKRSEIFCWRGCFPFKKHSFASRTILRKENKSKTILKCVQSKQL